MDKELASWLALVRVPGFGPKKWFKLLGVESRLSNCFNDFKPRKAFRQWCKAEGIINCVPDWQGVEADLAWASGQACHIVTWLQSTYPAQLRNIYNAPPLLFVKGDINVLSRAQLAMVGSRSPTAQGKQDAQRFAHALAKEGIVITSGLALGIDAASHQGALEANGGTVAVLGSSVDRIYPPEHRQLAQEICAEGALVSEYPSGTQARSMHFPQRNRIISGLSLGVFVVEATLKSGSLITANYALNQGREVFALPGSIHNPQAKGCHQLIRNGAKCVENLEHIMEELRYQRFNFVDDKEKVTSHALPKKSTIMEDTPSTSPFLKHIDEMCTPIDLVVDRTGLTAQAVSLILLELELQGLVASVPGGYVRVATGGLSDERECN